MTHAHVPNQPVEPIATGIDYAAFVSREKDGACALYLAVEGIRCASCAALIENALNQESDVTARVNMSTRRMTLRWEGPAARANDLIRKVSALGYKFLPFDQALLDSKNKREISFLWRCLIASGVASVFIMLLSMATPEANQTKQWIMALIAVPTLAYAGQPFFISAWNAIKHRHSNMDVPISLALVLTTAISLSELLHNSAQTYFDSVVMLEFFLLIGRYLDHKTRGKARAAAQKLLAMMAGTATIKTNGNARLVALRDLQAGMVQLVAAGEKIAADGVVENGSSEVDPSFITGETVTETVSPGTRVFGGMVNVLAPIAVRITAAGNDSLLGEVVKLMEKAEQGHARYVRLADRVAQYYTPSVFGLSFFTFLLWWLGIDVDWQSALLIATTVLIITCPCALGLAVPAVQVLASGRLFRRGMLLKSADALERMAQVDTIVFDKTGTLTLGKPHLVNAAEIDAVSMQLAASMAAHSKHPLAKAIQNGEAQEAQNVTETPGQGLTGMIGGRTVRLGRRDWCGDGNAPADDTPELWLKVENEPPVRFIFADELRRDAAAVVAQLKRDGYEIELLSGDREPVVARVAAALGITVFRARVTPVEKATTIEMLRQRGRRVLMVGDGLNDAPALTAADVSMSPSSALDITQNAADIVFQGAKLSPVLEALAVSKRADKLVRQNFVLALLYNALAVPLAMVGLVTPLIASIAMASSSIIVVANAQRLNR
jgi:Cu2+-exporting ATPase